MTVTPATSTGERRHLRLGFLGDDFSGSTDVLEVLTRFGLRAVLFTSLPTAGQLAALEPIDAVGIASNTRSLPLEAIDAVVRPALERLRDLGASILHYKVCSTFDSSPAIGSIGHVVDVGAEVLGTASVTIIVAAPELGRYCVFGNLFARSGLDSAPFRLDRHPTMSRHPVTPMTESDLRVHLAKQTARSIALLDVLDVAAGVERARESYRDLVASGAGAILIDALTDEHLATIGEVLLRETDTGGAAFFVGSSGIELALGEAWVGAGLSPGRVAFARPGPAGPILVLSGSCSPVTHRQVESALSLGFGDVEIDSPAVVAGGSDSGLETAAARAVAMLRRNRSVVIHTALGPDDPRIDATRSRLAEGGATAESQIKARCGAALSRALGVVGRNILAEQPPRRVVVTGGDTGWGVARELGIEMLEVISPMAPGSPLCRARGRGLPAVDGLEIVFKGGQVGKADLLEEILRGTG